MRISKYQINDLIDQVESRSKFVSSFRASSELDVYIGVFVCWRTFDFRITGPRGESIFKIEIRIDAYTDPNYADLVTRAIDAAKSLCGIEVEA